MTFPRASFHAVSPIHSVEYLGSISACGHLAGQSLPRFSSFLSRADLFTRMECTCVPQRRMLTECTPQQILQPRLKQVLLFPRTIQLFMTRSRPWPGFSASRASIYTGNLTRKSVLFVPTCRPLVQMMSRVCHSQQRILEFS